MAMFMMFFLLEKKKIKKYNMLVVPVLILLLLKSDAKTALLALALGLFLLLFLKVGLFNRWLFVVSMFTSVVTIIVAFWFIIQYFDSFAMLFGKESTLLTRLQIWNYSIDKILEKPLFGYGFESFWLNKNEIYSNLYWDVPHAHNTLIGICIDTGLVGLGVFMIMVVDSFVKCFVNVFKNDAKEYIWYFINISILLLLTISDLNITTPNNILWIFFTLNIFAIGNGKQTVCIRRKDVVLSG